LNELNHIPAKLENNFLVIKSYAIPYIDLQSTSPFPFDSDSTYSLNRVHCSGIAPFLLCWPVLVGWWIEFFSTLLKQSSWSKLCITGI